VPALPFASESFDDALLIDFLDRLAEPCPLLSWDPAPPLRLRPLLGCGAVPDPLGSRVGAFAVSL
jgi:hypothetical protein